MKQKKSKVHKHKKVHKKLPKKNEVHSMPSLKLVKEKDIALDFATKVYQRFNKIIKSIALFGSTVKKTNVEGSDIDIVIIIDDVTIKWDEDLILWYRENLEKLVKKNPYEREIHITTIKLTTWWEDLIRGDPTILNMLRYGEAIIDFGGFFEPLKYLLVEGKIKSTPEAVYSLLQRAPLHLTRSKVSELNAIEGIFWSMVDSAHAAIITAGKTPPSPEHIPGFLRELFVDREILKSKYVSWYFDLHTLHKKISHGEITSLKGVELDMWQERAEEFLRTMAELVNKIIG